MNYKKSAKLPSIAKKIWQKSRNPIKIANSSINIFFQKTVLISNLKKQHGIFTTKS